MKISLILSAIIHILILSAFFLHTNQEQRNENKGGAHSGDQPGAIIPKTVEIDIVTDPVHGKGAVKLPKQKHTDGLTECKKDQWYGGIGINQDYISNAIQTVADGYPAQKAGMLIGDVILDVESNDGSKEIRGEPGTTVIIMIQRGVETFTLSMKRDRICTEGKI